MDLNTSNISYIYPSLITNDFNELFAKTSPDLIEYPWLVDAFDFQEQMDFLLCGIPFLNREVMYKPGFRRQPSSTMRSSRSVNGALT